MVLKELILTDSTLEGCGGLGRCGGLERKNKFLTDSTLEGCGGLKRTDF